MLASLRQNLIDAFVPGCGEDGKRHDAVLFALLKTQDDDKLLLGQSHSNSFARHEERTASVSALAAALASRWLLPILGEAVIVDGAGTFLGKGWTPSQAERERPGMSTTATSAERAVRPSNDTEWMSYRTAGCVAARNRTHSTDPGLEARMLKSQLSIQWCAGAISRYETRRSTKEGASWRFDLVVYHRPDQARWQPLQPWCAWADVRERALLCSSPAHDGMWAIPRQHAGVVLHQAERYASCNDTSVHGGNRAVPTSCCFSAESLLKYATRHIAKDPTACHALNARTTLFRGVQRSKVEASGVGGKRAVPIIGGSRAYRHVCDVVLSRTYAAGSYAHSMIQTMGGLQVQTGVELRRMFGNSTVACKLALAPYDDIAARGGVHTRPELWQPWRLHLDRPHI